MINPGDWVRFTTLPPWVRELPEDSQEVFRFCVGGTFQVLEVDCHRHLVLDVSPEVDERFGGFLNDIRVEEEYVTKVDRE